MVDRGGLENRCACKRTVGSNPTLSARARSCPSPNIPKKALYFKAFVAKLIPRKHQNIRPIPTIAGYFAG